jgi:uncharacterized protein YuzE
VKINHDKIADALYISLKKGPIAHTSKVKNNIILDTDKNGLIVGIEIIHASNVITAAANTARSQTNTAL